MTEAGLRGAGSSGESRVDANTMHGLKSGMVRPNADLRCVDASDVDLHGAVLTNAKLPAVMDRVNLMDADLTGARGLNVSAVGANFDRANLDEADLSGADLSGASFRDANLAGAILHDARLVGADFTGADLSYADFSEADLSDTSLLSASKLNDLYLAGAKGIGLPHEDDDEDDEWDDDTDSDSGESSASTDEPTICELLQERGAGWGLDDLPYDLRCPACNSYDAAEIRYRHRHSDGYYDCDLCDGYGRMTPAELDAVLGDDRLQCIWCRGEGSAGNYMPGSAAWACVVCWGTGRMPAWALAINEVLNRADLERNQYLEYEASRIKVDVEGLVAAGFRFNEIEFAGGARFTRCDFTDASFANSVIPSVTFTDCDLSRVDFTRASLPGATFVRCTLSGCRPFEADDLSGVSIVFGSTDSQQESE